MTTVATHSGPFHADDVMAWALIQTFHDAEASIIRTRDAARIDAADLVIDVGAIYDPERGRFDHHQAAYDGPLSSAGMILAWLVSTQAISESLGDHLRRQALDYLDAVDTGRVAPTLGVPCFPKIVEAMNQTADAVGGFDVAFEHAAGIARLWVAGMVAEHDKLAASRAVVWPLMDAAAEAGSNVLELPEYISWKAAYFERGGSAHPTEYCCFPGTDGSYRIVAIPPKFGDFGQKRPLPIEWAGLTDEALAEVVGVPSARFCHKNQFIAVFGSREDAWTAMESWGLLQPQG